MSARPVRTSSPAAARVHRVVEVARLALKKPVSRCRNLVRISAKRRLLPAAFEAASVRYRHDFAAHFAFDERRLSNPQADLRWSIKPQFLGPLGNFR